MSARVQGDVVRRARSGHLAAIKPCGRTPRIEDSVASTRLSSSPPRTFEYLLNGTRVGTP